MIGKWLERQPNMETCAAVGAGPSPSAPGGKTP